MYLSCPLICILSWQRPAASVQVVFFATRKNVVRFPCRVTSQSNFRSEMDMGPCRVNQSVSQSVTESVSCSKQPQRVDCRRCHQPPRPSTSFVDNTIDLPWRNFLSPEFGTKFQKKETLFRRYLDFLKHNVGQVEGSFHAANQLDLSRPACDRPTYRQTDGQTYDHSEYRASIASRGKRFTQSYV